MADQPVDHGQAPPRDLEQVRVAVPAVRAQPEVHVPQQHVPPASVGAVGEHVLAAVVAVAVPVRHHVPQGERAHPLPDVGLGLHRGGELVVGEVGRVHEVEQVAVVVVVAVVDLLLPVPAVARLLLQAVGHGVDAELGVLADEVRVGAPELEPVVDLEQVAHVVVREPGFDVVRAHVVRVRVHVAVRVPVHVDPDQPLVAVRQAQAAREPEARALALAGRVPPLLQGVQVELVGAEDGVVLGRADHVRVDACPRPLHRPADERAAAVPDVRVVDRALVAVDEGHVQRLVAERRAGRPLVHVRLRQPEPVAAQLGRVRVLAPADHAFAGRRVVGELRGGRRGVGVRGGHAERDDRAAGLARDRRAVDPRAGVRHGHAVGRRGRIHAIPQAHVGGHPVGVVDPRPHDDGLVPGRHDGRVRDVVDRGAGVGGVPAVDRARRAEVRGHGERADGLQVVAPQAQEEVRAAAEPPPHGPEGVGRAGAQRGGEAGLDPVRARVPAAVGAEVQAAAAQVAGGLKPRRDVVALHRPSPQPRLEGGVGHPVRPAQVGHHDVVEQALALLQEHDVQLVDRGPGVVRPVVEHTRALDIRPRALGRLVAVGPVGGQPVVAARVHQFQAASTAVRPLAPPPAVLVEDLVHHDHILRVVGHGQGDAFPAVGERAGVVAHHLAGREVGVVDQQARLVPRHYEVPARRDDRALRDREGDPVLELPQPHVHVARAPVVQLDVLLVVVLRDRVVHDLVDHDVADVERRVGGALRRRRQLVEAGRAVGIPAAGHAVLLRLVPDRVHHVRIRRPQEDQPALGLQVEPELVRHPRREAPRGEDRIRDPVLVRGRIVAEETPAQVHRLRAGVVDLDVVPRGKVRVGEELVDDHVGQDARRDDLRRAGRTAGGRAGRPRARVALPVGAPAQHQRRARAVGRGRPRRAVGVLRLQQDRAAVVAQAHGALAVGQAAGVGADHVGDAVDRLHRGRVFRHDEVAQAREHGAGGERVVRVAREAVAAEPPRDRFGVEHLDELEILPVRPVGRVVHDLGKDERRPAARRPGGGRADRGQADIVELQGALEADAVRVDHGAHPLGAGGGRRLHAVADPELGQNGEVVGDRRDQVGRRVVELQLDALDRAGPVVVPSGIRPEEPREAVRLPRDRRGLLPPAAVVRPGPRSADGPSPTALNDVPVGAGDVAPGAAVMVGIAQLPVVGRAPRGDGRLEARVPQQVRRPGDRHGAEREEQGRRGPEGSRQKKAFHALRVHHALIPARPSKKGPNSLRKTIPCLYLRLPGNSRRCIRWDRGHTRPRRGRAREISTAGSAPTAPTASR